MIASPNGVALSDEIIAHCGDRAAGYDRDNRFFTEDFEELRAAGYLKMAIPKEFGGAGLSLAEVCREQRRLAYRAPATALATNMHLYWTGVAADLRRMGDASLEWMLREAAAGEVFAAGHGEAGNDLPLFLSTAKAERADGGYRFWGHKTFSSLTPVWTRLGLHAMHAADPRGPRGSVRPRHLRLGRADLRQHLSRPRGARARPGRRRREEADLARPHALDGLSPGGPALLLRDAARPGGGGSPGRSRGPGVVDRRGPRRPVAHEARSGQAQCRRGGQESGRPRHGRLGRRGHVQVE